MVIGEDRLQKWDLGRGTKIERRKKNRRRERKKKKEREVIGRGDRDRD